MWLVDTGGQQNRQLKIAAGRCLDPNWSADGKTILYLNYPEDPHQLHAIRELAPDTGADKLVAKTSQFASFAFNRDTSVFAGASANRGSPTVLILLRITRRELTLCEHKASQPENVTLMFSPDSQRIYFESDRDGKPAIYCLHVEQAGGEDRRGNAGVANSLPLTVISLLTCRGTASCRLLTVS